MAVQLGNFHLWNVYKTYLAKETDNYKKEAFWQCDKIIFHSYLSSEIYVSFC
jgi:hypothetical protein